MSATAKPAEAPTIVQALANVMADVRAVHKDDTNPQQGFKFRGIDAVVNACGPALRTHGVIVTPEVESADYGTVEVGRNRTQMGHVRVKVRYTFWGPAGDSLSCVVVAESMDAGDKATPKAMSVAFRTALLQALCLPTDEPDPDSQVYERSEAPVPAQRDQSPQASQQDMAMQSYVRSTVGEAVRAHTDSELPTVTDDRALSVDTRPWLTPQLATVLSLGDGSAPVPLSTVLAAAGRHVSRGDGRSAVEAASDLVGAA